MNRSAPTGRMPGSRRSRLAAGGRARGPGGRRLGQREPAFDRQGDRRRQRRVEAQQPLAALGIVLAVDSRTGRGPGPSGAPGRRRAPGGRRGSPRPGDRSAARGAGRRPASRPRGAGPRRGPRAGECRPDRASSTARRSGRSGPAGPRSTDRPSRSIRPRATGTPCGTPSAGGSTIRRAVGIALTGRLSTSAPASSACARGGAADTQPVRPGPGDDDRRQRRPRAPRRPAPPGRPSWPRCPGPTTTGTLQANGPRPRAISSISVSTRISCSLRRATRCSADTAVTVGRRRRASPAPGRTRRRKSSRRRITRSGGSPDRRSPRRGSSATIGSSAAVVAARSEAQAAGDREDQDRHGRGAGRVADERALDADGRPRRLGRPPSPSAPARRSGWPARRRTRRRCRRRTAPAGCRRAARRRPPRGPAG